MKAINKIVILFFVLNFGTLVAPQKAAAQVSINFQIFYDNLSPYGNWVNNSNYGYVWIPEVSSGFTPYATNGYWVFTNVGWTWVSNYPWGWAPFHYGRWYNDPSDGWVWVPDNEWGPGWVSWRRSNDYYGWAPIGPGISFEIAYSSGYNLPYNQWTFVRDRDFGRTNITNYYINNSNNVTIIKNPTIKKTETISDGMFSDKDVAKISNTLVGKPFEGKAIFSAVRNIIMQYKKQGYILFDLINFSFEDKAAEYCNQSFMIFWQHFMQNRSIAVISQF